MGCLSSLRHYLGLNERNGRLARTRLNQKKMASFSNTVGEHVQALMVQTRMVRLPSPVSSQSSLLSLFYNIAIPSVDCSVSTCFPILTPPEPLLKYSLTLVRRLTV